MIYIIQDSENNKLHIYIHINFITEKSKFNITINLSIKDTKSASLAQW